MPKASITANHCIEKSSVSKPLLSPKSLGLASSSTSKFEYLNSQSETLDCGFCTEAELIERKHELCLLSCISRYANLRIPQQSTKKRMFEMSGV